MTASLSPFSANGLVRARIRNRLKTLDFHSRFDGPKSQILTADRFF
jgi:hypothetical protein